MVVDRSTVMLSLLAAFVLAVLVALGIVLARERRAYARDGKARAWTFVRLAALPLLLATVAVVVVPARAIGGPEALAAFYLALFTAAPLIWFGGHWIAGRAARPALSASESFLLAATPPAFLIAAAFLAGALQPLAWSITLAAERAGYGMAAEAPARHALAASRRWTTPAGDVVFARWQAPDDVQVERIDVVTGEQVIENAGRTLLHRLCQAPGAIVLVQPASEALPSLRIYWRDSDRRLRVSLLTPPPPPVAASTFDVRWLGDDGFDLPEPVPRQIISLALQHDPPGSFFGEEAQRYRPGETFDQSCLPPGWQGRFPLRGLRLRIDRTASPEPLWIEALRSAPATDQSS